MSITRPTGTLFREEGLTRLKHTTKKSREKDLAAFTCKCYPAMTVPSARVMVWPL